MGGWIVEIVRNGKASPYLEEGENALKIFLVFSDAQLRKEMLEIKWERTVKSLNYAFRLRQVELC